MTSRTPDPALGPAIGPTSAAAPLRMLYVEDDADLRELACMVLAASGEAEVESAADGQGALDAVAAADPAFDALLIDAGLPAPNGPEVVRRLRADPRHDAMAILFCTGRSDAQDALLACGADAVLIKPMKLGEIPARARAALARRRAAASQG